MAKKNDYKKYINTIKKAKLKQAKTDFCKIINEVNNQLSNEIVKIYESYVDQFYSYETTSYIRHGQHQVGTMSGENLYRGLTINRKSGLRPSLSYYIDARDMDGEYQYDSAENVLDYVINGTRFPYFKNPMKWSGTYKSDLFIYEGTLIEAIIDFDKKYDSMASELFHSKWIELGY